MLVAVALLVAGADRLRDKRMQADANRQASDFTRAQLLPQSPARAIRMLYAAVAQGDPAMCPAFSPVAAGQLAATTGATDCTDAIRLLHNQVGDPRRYQRPDRASIADQLASDGQTGTATGCAATWTDIFGPAPAPGTSADTMPGPR